MASVTSQRRRATSLSYHSEEELDAFAGGPPSGDHHASVVDERVEVIGSVADLRGGLVDTRDGGYVRPDDDGGRQLLGEPLDALGVATDEDEVVPVLCEPIGSGAPEARGGADEGDGAGWPGHRYLLSAQSEDGLDEPLPEARRDVRQHSEYGDA
jgi:hypothetical protein